MLHVEELRVISAQFARENIDEVIGHLLPGGSRYAHALLDSVGQPAHWRFERRLRRGFDDDIYEHRMVYRPDPSFATVMREFSLLISEREGVVGRIDPW